MDAHSLSLNATHCLSSKASWVSPTQTGHPSRSLWPTKLSAEAHGFLLIVLNAPNKMYRARKEVGKTTFALPTVSTTQIHAMVVTHVFHSVRI